MSWLGKFRNDLVAANFAYWDQCQKQLAVDEIMAVIEAIIEDEDDIDHPLSRKMTHALAALAKKVEGK